MSTYLKCIIPFSWRKRICTYVQVWEIFKRKIKVELGMPKSNLYKLLTSNAVQFYIPHSLWCVILQSSLNLYNCSAAFLFYSQVLSSMLSRCTSRWIREVCIAIGCQQLVSMLVTHPIFHCFQKTFAILVSFVLYAVKLSISRFCMIVYRATQRRYTLSSWIARRVNVSVYIARPTWHMDDSSTTLIHMKGWVP